MGKLLKKQPSAHPGFALTFGITTSFLALVVLLPLSLIVVHASALSVSEFSELLLSKRVSSALRLSFGTAFAAGLTNIFVGGLFAWVLSRYRFPGKRILDAAIDLPFALPTAVAGIALTTLYAPSGLIGKVLGEFGIRGSYTPIGIYVALTFVGLPFVVRAVQPLLDSMDPELEEAAVVLGATPSQTFFGVILPTILPGIITGFSLAFARALGEYGSVVFISGNLPMKTEILPLLIMTKLEQYQQAEAAALAMVMLVVSFCILLVINLTQLWSKRRSY